MSNRLDRGRLPSKFVQLPRSECSSWTSAVSRPGASFQHSHLDYPVSTPTPEVLNSTGTRCGWAGSLATSSLMTNESLLL